MMKKTGLLVSLVALAVGVGLSCGPEKTKKTADKAVGESRADSQDVRFAANAFPPTIPDSEHHQDAWQRNDCLHCHETGVGVAPVVRHAGLPSILLKAKCRSCHVFIRGEGPSGKPKAPTAGQRQFAAHAFPPMIPRSEVHANTWMVDNCLDCHLRGKQGAPKIRHRNVPPLAIKVKCRTCHVQVRAAGIDDPG